MVINLLDEELNFNFIFAYFQTQRNKIIKLKNKEDIINQLELFEDMFIKASLNLQNNGKTKHEWDYKGYKFFSMVIMRLNNLIYNLDNTHDNDENKLALKFIRKLCDNGAYECAIQFLISALPVSTYKMCFDRDSKDLIDLLEDIDYQNIYNALNTINNMMDGIDVSILKDENNLYYFLLLYRDHFDRDINKVLATALLHLDNKSSKYFDRRALVIRCNIFDAYKYSDVSNLNKFSYDKPFSSEIFKSVRFLSTNGYWYYTAKQISDGAQSMYNIIFDDKLGDDLHAKLLKNSLSNTTIKDIRDVAAYAVMFDNIDSRIKHSEIYMKNYDESNCYLNSYIKHEDLEEIENIIIEKIKDFFNNKKYISKTNYHVIMDISLLNQSFEHSEFLEKLLEEIKSCKTYKDEKKRKYEMEIKLSIKGNN